jgi:hypothetical protein
MVVLPEEVEFMMSGVFKHPLPDVEPIPARETDHPALALGIAVCCLPAYALGIITVLICERVF